MPHEVFISNLIDLVQRVQIHAARLIAGSVDNIISRMINSYHTWIYIRFVKGGVIFHDSWYIMRFMEFALQIYTMIYYAPLLQYFVVSPFTLVNEGSILRPWQHLPLRHTVLKFYVPWQCFCMLCQNHKSLFQNDSSRSFGLTVRISGRSQCKQKNGKILTALQFFFDAVIFLQFPFLLFICVLLCPGVALFRHVKLLYICLVVLWVETQLCAQLCIGIFTQLKTSRELAGFGQGLTLGPHVMTAIAYNSTQPATLPSAPTGLWRISKSTWHTLWTGDNLNTSTYV